MRFILPTLGTTAGAGNNVYDTPSSRAANMAAGAASQRLGQGGAPHKVLSQATGSATAMLVTSSDLSSGNRVAQIIGQHLSALTNSPTGTPAGVQPVNGIVNGQANIRDGIAVISGMNSGR